MTFGKPSKPKIFLNIRSAVVTIRGVQTGLVLPGETA